MLLGAGMLLTGCTGADRTAEPTASAPGSTSTQAAADAGALGTACATFWGDPEYIDPLSRTVLAQAASAPEIGPSDPGFYALTGDEVDTAFEGAPTQARQAAGALSDWFRTEPERGAEADLEAFRSAYEGLASSCRETSAAARWALAPGKDGTKPAALVCADVFDTPGTLTHFANANVLTSNMFKLVGLSPREVPAGREQDVRDTADLLSAEIAAVDDEAVRNALDQVLAPFLDALEGDTWSDGLRGPLSELGTACEAVGYSSPEIGEGGDGTIVGAHAQDPHVTNHGGRS